MESKIWYLSQINVLKNLSGDQLMELANLCGMRTLQRGENLYLPGEANDIYFLKKGSVKLISNSKEGEELIQDIIYVGEIFGQLQPGDLGSGLESAVAMEEVVVCFLPVSAWQNFFFFYIPLKLSILKWVGFKIRKVERKIDRLYFKDARTRVMELFADLAQLAGTPIGGNVKLRMRLTHEEIAQLTGNSRQSTTTLMNALRKEGLIDYNRNRITINRSLLSLMENK